MGRKKKNKISKIKVKEEEIVDKYKFPDEFNNLLDINRILRSTKNKKKLKVKLVKDDIKGISMYARKNIKTGEVIAYYKLRVFNHNKYTSPTNYIYAFSVYGSNEKEYKTYISDIDLESIPEPLNNIPYWGLFINEPNSDQDVNSWVDTDYKFNFKKQGRKKVKSGIYLTYKIVANRHIEPGEEITIYYGTEYERDYKLDIKKFDK